MDIQPDPRVHVDVVEDRAGKNADPSSLCWDGAVCNFTYLAVYVKTVLRTSCGTFSCCVGGGSNPCLTSPCRVGMVPSC